MNQKTEDALKPLDLEDFYNHNERVGCDGALIVITPKQTISALSPQEHFVTLQEIYRRIYGKTDEIDYQEWDSLELFEKTATENGHVLIQVCYGMFSPVWIPDKINSYQFEELEKLVEFIRINRLNERYMEWVTNIDSKRLNEVLPSLVDRISNLQPTKEERDFVLSSKKR